MKTAVIYARYSSERQTEQSIEGQLRDCNEYAQRNDIVIVDTYIDRAMTGTNDNRAAFQKMLKDCEKRAWDYVLIYKTDRFGRNKYEIAVHKHTLSINGIKLIPVKENIPEGPEGIILESLLEGMAEYYSAELSQKVKRGMRESRNKGNFTGGYVLYGYRVENKKLVICENEAQIVRQIFEECAAGKLVKTILDELNEKGILNHGKPFARNTLYHLLANEKYAGIVRHGDEIFTNIYPRIVSDTVFSVVKSKLGGNKYGKHKPNVCYLLKNKIKCGYCGKTVNSDSGTSKNGTIMRYYKCMGKRTNKNCPLNPIRKEFIEQLVIDATYKALSKPSDISALADKILDVHKKCLNDRSILNILTNEYADIQRAIANILNAIEKGIFTSSTKDRLEQLELRRDELSNQIALEKSKTKLLLTKEDIMNYLQKALRKEPKPMIDHLVKEVILYNDKVEIYYNYTNKEKPDGDDDHQAFSFYSYEKNYDLTQYNYDSKPKKSIFNITLFI